MMNDFPPLLVGLDVGSTNVKAVVYRPDGHTVALASAPTTTHYPRPAWAYYDPAELWGQAVRVLREATARLDDPRRIAGIAVASVGEAGVPLDAAGEPLYEAIAWFDRRTIPQRDWLAEAIGEDALFATSGLSLQPIFTLCKLLWLKENEPEVWAKTRVWLNVADFIAFKLCGVPATDFSLASRTLALDLANLRWADDLVRAAGIDPGVLAPAVASGTRIGAVTPEAARATGLPDGAAVAAGGHDHVCGALAAGVTSPGTMLDSMGTAEALFLALDRPLTDPALGRQGYTQGAHVVPGHYYVFGGLYTSGASVEWWRNVLGGTADWTELANAAEAVPPGSLGAFFLPHLRLANAPYADARARGAFVGLSTDVTQATLTRALFEGLAYEARLTTEPLLAYAGLPTMPEVSVIGGSTRNDLLLRIKAAVWNTRLRVFDLDEATALGAAILGGIGAGVYRDVPDALRTLGASPRTVDPDPTLVPLYDAAFRRVYRRLYLTLRGLNHEIHELASREP